MRLKIAFNAIFHLTLYTFAENDDTFMMLIRLTTRDFKLQNAFQTISILLFLPKLQPVENFAYLLK